MEYRVLSMDYCIFTTGRDFLNNRTEYTVQVPATIFSSEFMFTIWINDEDKAKGKMYEIIRNKIKELMSTEYNLSKNLSQEINEAEEQIQSLYEDGYEIKKALLDEQNNSEYHRKKYLEKVRECEDLKAELQVSRNNTEYFKKKLEERNACIMEYVDRERKSQDFEAQQNQAIAALRNQILELKNPNYPFSFVCHVRLKEIELEITYRMEYTKLKNDHFYHFIIEDDQVSYVPQIFFYQSQRDDAAAIEYAQNLLNNEATLYRKLRIQDDIIEKQKKRIRSLEKIIAEYREKAQGNY